MNREEERYEECQEWTVKQLIERLKEYDENLEVMVRFDQFATRSYLSVYQHKDALYIEEKGH